MNGPSTLTLVGTNTLTSLTFNVDGGAQTGPAVAVGAQLNLTGSITASGSNPNAAAAGGATEAAFATPSGGNDFHGELFWYNRNNHFAANDWQFVANLQKATDWLVARKVLPEPVKVTDHLAEV